MSLAVVFKGAEGLVLAADSRVTLTAFAAPPPGAVPEGVVVAPQVMHTYFDNATKLLGLKDHRYLGIVTYGQGAIGQQQPRMAHGYMPEFERWLARLKTNARQSGSLPGSLGSSSLIAGQRPGCRPTPRLWCFSLLGSM